MTQVSSCASFFASIAKFEAARARNRFFSVEFLDVFVPNMNCREGLLAMRTGDDAFVRELRVVFERALAEKRRRVALSAQEAAMCLLVCDQLFFRSNTSSHFSQGNRGLQVLMCVWCCIFEGSTRPQFLHVVGIGVVAVYRHHLLEKKG